MAGTSVVDDRQPQKAAWPAGGGEMGERIRAFDWAKTPLGPIESWSPTLRMMTGFLLANRFPLLLWWGPEFIQIYNDAYRPVLGAKHPSPGLGRPVRECWSEIWHILKPLIETPYQGGPSTWMEDITLEINRYGFAEETHFTIAYSPVPDEGAPGGIGGVLATVHEITEKVVGERRLGLLRNLGARSGEAKSPDEACAIAAETLSGAEDAPYCLFYLFDGGRKQARLAASSGLGRDGRASAAAIALSPGFADFLISEQVETAGTLAGQGRGLPAGPWLAGTGAAVAPIRSNVPREPAGFLVAGLSPTLRFDENYRAFVDLMSAQIATAVARGRAYEEERTRAEQLAELDRAKTAFFSNVSHEFRTPLTLLLGPLEDALAKKDSLPPAVGANLAVAHRNGLRLLKLVNTILDFSRIEAGRMDASYEATDLGAYTAELASVFRSAIEKAGIELAINCRKLPQPVYVDREMWEKIVLNLLSNAFKFTFVGEIAVSLKWEGDRVALSVRDTGVGISEGEAPKVFTRFHRVRGARARTHEGTGIGLSLVQELARLHGGEATVASREGEGSTFTVRIKTGTAHLPAEHVRATRRHAARSAASLAEEAAHYLPPEPSAGSGDGPGGAQSRTAGAARILLADDNKDMREYVRRMLVANFSVEAVADGQAALESIRARPPDLILTDVMMPRLDGFSLLKEVRDNPATRDIPVVVLSARAGEEARVEGLNAGADDYMIKPFSARELIARVESLITRSRARRLPRE